MKRTYFSALGFGCILLSSGDATATDPPISARELGEILGYPPHRITVVDGTEERNAFLIRKGRETVISSHVYRTSDNTFAPVTITIGAMGSLLTPELRGYAEELLGTDEELVRKVIIPGKGEGYFGLGNLGPGGSNEQIVASMPEYNRDLKVSITFFGDAPLEPLAGNEKYYELASTDGGIEAVLLRCIEAVFSRLGTAAGETTGQEANGATSNGTNQVHQLPPFGDDAEGTKVSAGGLSGRDWMWIAGAALFFTLVAIVMYRCSVFRKQ